MVKTRGNQDIMTEDDDLDEALAGEEYFDVDGLSLHEKREILEVIRNSKQESQQVSAFMQATKDITDVSSTTLEKSAGDNIVVQIEDSLDADPEFANLSRADLSHIDQSSNNSAPVQHYDSFEENDIIENSQACTSVIPVQKNKGLPLEELTAWRRATGEEMAQQRTLMQLNVLDHKMRKDDKTEFYLERLAKLRCESKKHPQRLPWYYDNKSSLSRDEHYASALKEVEHLASVAAKKRLARMGKQMCVHVNPDDLDDEPWVDVSVKPTEVPYKQVVAFTKNIASEENQKEDSKQSAPKKIIIKPRIVNLEEDDDEIFDPQPGPSSRSGGFISLSQGKSENEHSKENEMDEQEDEVAECKDSSDLMECPVCALQFDKSKIESHVELCLKKNQTELGDACPLCNVNLPAESLKEKHMEKCRNKQAKLKFPNSVSKLSLRYVKELAEKKSAISDFEDSDEDPPPPKKRCS